MTDNLNPRMPSAEIIVTTADFWNMDDETIVEIFAEYCGRLAGRWIDFWLWRQKHRNATSRRSEIITDSYPRLFFDDDKQPPEAFYMVAETLTDATTGELPY